MTVEEMIESAGSYTSLVEVADMPQTEEPAAISPLIVLTITAFADC